MSSSSRSQDWHKDLAAPPGQGITLEWTSHSVSDTSQDVTPPLVVHTPTPRSVIGQESSLFVPVLFQPAIPQPTVQQPLRPLRCARTSTPPPWLRPPPASVHPLHLPAITPIALADSLYMVDVKTLVPEYVLMMFFGFTPPKLLPAHHPEPVVVTDGLIDQFTKVIGHPVSEEFKSSALLQFCVEFTLNLKHPLTPPTHLYDLIQDNPQYIGTR